MKLPRNWAWGLIGLSWIGGISFVPGLANAQESSLTDAKEKTKQSPTSADASIAYGRALRRAGRQNDALNELRRGQIFATGDAAITVEWEIARTHIAKRDFYSAMSACSAIKKLKLSKGDASFHACAGEAHLLWKRGTEALAEVAEVAKIKDASADVVFYTKLVEGRCRELDSKDAEAETAYREAIRLAPNRFEGHLLLGAMLHRIGKTTEGISLLKKAAELDSKDPVVQFELGHAYSADATKKSEAIAAFEKAAQERPTYIEALRALTEAYVAANRLGDAKKTASAVLKIAPSDVLAHVVSGRVALADGKIDEALKEGEIALKLMPNEGKAKLLVADAYAKKGEIDLALEAYQKASGLDPLDPAPLVNATYACITHNRLTSAKAFGQRAVLDFPKYWPAWVAQGDALAADGNPAPARTAYETAKKQNGADVAAIDAKLAKLR